MHRFYQLTLAFVTILALCQTADGQKLLRWKFAPGDNIQVNFQQDMDMSTEMMGNSLKTTADMGMTLGWQIQEVSPQGVAEISQSIERLQLRMENPGAKPIVYDSASTEPPEGLAKNLAGSIGPLVGLKFVQEMDPRGEILDVRLSDQAKAEIAKAPAAAQIRQVFSKDGLKALLHQAATVLPENPVSPGDTWNSQMDTKSPVGTLQMDMQYTYRGTQEYNGRPLEVIDVNVRVGFGDGPNPLGLKVKVASQENRGALFFDAAAGRFVSTQLNQKMVLETAVGEKVHRQELSTVLKMQFAKRQSTGGPVARTASVAP